LNNKTDVTRWSENEIDEESTFLPLGDKDSIDKMALYDEVKEVLVAQLAIKPDMVKPDSKVTELGADSLDTIELVAALEEKFGISIPEDDVRQIATVTDIVNLVEQKLRSKASA